MEELSPEAGKRTGQRTVEARNRRMNRGQIANAASNSQCFQLSRDTEVHILTLRSTSRLSRRPGCPESRKFDNRFFRYCDIDRLAVRPFP